MKQITQGLTIEQVKFTMSLPVLRDASVGSMVSLYNFLNVQMAEMLSKR
jgi:hypothetical protein